MLEIEIRLHQLELHQDRRVAPIAEEIDPGIKKLLFHLRQDRPGGGQLVGRRGMGADVPVILGLNPEIPRLRPLADGVAEGAADVDERTLPLGLDRGKEGLDDRRSGRSAIESGAR